MKKAFTILLPCCLISASAAPFISLSSCSEQDLEITVDKNKLICYEHEFTLNYKANRSIPNDTRLGIIGAGSDLFIDASRTDFTKETGTLAFKINSGIHYDKQIDYTLVFSYGDKEILIEGLQVLYVFQEEDYKDEIKATQKTITNQDDWEYTYRFQFSNAPLSKVKARLISRSQELLELIEDEIEVKKEGNLYYLDVPIHLSYGIVENNFLTFDIEFSFTNSFGFTQVTTINDLGCEFKFTPTDVVPRDLLDIRSIGGGYFDLYGFKDNVPISSINHFSVLSITGIREISGAFDLIDGNPDTYKSILKIKISSSVTNVCKEAFIHFNNLEELDLSEYEGVPQWLESKIEHDYPIFNSEEWTHKSGIVWVDGIYDEYSTPNSSREDWVKYLEHVGLGAMNKYDSPQDKWEHSWTPYATSEVTPSDWFITKEKNNIVTLTAVDSTKFTWRDLVKIGVIKIPDNVTAISLNPEENQSDFSVFRETSCDFNPLGYEEDYLGHIYNRRLILNKNLTEINQNIDGKGAFYQVGICGNVILPNSLEFIENNTFEDATYRTYPGMEEMKLYYNAGFQCSSNPSLRKIGTNAFTKSRIEYCTIPSSVNQLGDSLFSECEQLTSIDFSTFINTPSGIETSAPLDGLISGSNKHFYINQISSSDDWTNLIKSWNNDVFPGGWTIIKK